MTTEEEQGDWLTEPEHVCDKPFAGNDREGGLWRCRCGQVWQFHAWTWEWVPLSERNAQRVLRRKATACLPKKVF